MDTTVREGGHVSQDLGAERLGSKGEVGPLIGEEEKVGLLEDRERWARQVELRLEWTC